MNSPRILLTPGGLERARRGHPWIFRNDIRTECEIPNGEIVSALTERGDLVGRGFWSTQSRIALRLITRDNAPIDDAFWRARMVAAGAYRDRFVSDATAFRLISSDSDGIPGLIVDRYANHLVVQSLIPGVDRLLDRFTALLVETFSAESVLARNDSSMRELEGMAREVRPLFGATPDVIEIREGAVRTTAQPATGQKTGAFLDQRENRMAAAGYARGRALDLFCYHGAFALHAAAHCDRVIAVDSSSAAIARGRANAALNGRDNIEFVEANVFEFLKDAERSASRTAGPGGYETIFLDPPAFAKRRSDLESALRAYKDVNLRALRLLAPGGFLVTSSCSFNLSENDFLSVLRDAAADARRPVRVVERRGATRDHPVLLGLPESAYLKCFILHV